MSRFAIFSLQGPGGGIPSYMHLNLVNSITCGMKKRENNLKETNGFPRPKSYVLGACTVGELGPHSKPVSVPTCLAEGASPHMAALILGHEERIVWFLFHIMASK